MATSISVQSKEYRRWSIKANTSGATINPTTDAVSIAFTPPGATPAPGDFITASWETDNTTSPATYYVRSLIGPGGDTNPPAGRYEVRAKIVDNPEIPVLYLGELVVTAPAATQWPTPLDLGTYLGITIPSAQTAQAQSALDAAKSLIQEYTEQTLDQVLGDIVTLDGISRTGMSSYSGGGSANVGGAGAAGYSGYGFVQTLQLPETPVTNVSAITVDGIAITPNVDFYWNPSGLLWRPYGFIWGYQPRSVVVTYDHGFAALPAGLRTVCLSVATRIFANPQGLLRENIGNYSAMYYSTRAVVGALEPEEQALLNRYRFLVLA